MMKRVLSVVLTLTMLFSVFGFNTYASEINTNADNKDVIEKELDEDIIDSATSTTAMPTTVKHMLEQYRFTASQGHGFAAERGNNLADQIKGKNATVVGDNNVKNGPDRLIISRDGTKTYIQTKYYKTASESVNAAFENGQYKYKIGKQIIELEVPKDQYEEAVRLMKQKISQGMVEGVTDPEKAETIVRKGAVSYKQAHNLAKTGKIASLKYDAINGAISATSAMGISTVINYSVMRLYGADREQALQQSALEGVRTGSLVLCASVISGQLSKTLLKDAFQESSEALVKTFGTRFANSLLESAGEATVDTLSNQAIQKAARILRSNVIASVVTVVVFTGPDAVDLFRGRISRQQFVKNFVVIATSVAAGTAAGIGGAALGNILLPGVGGYVGGIVGGVAGGTAGGYVADAIGDHFFEDDAEALYVIVEDVFYDCCEEYLVSEEEANNIIEDFSKKMTEKAYKDMYKSDDRPQYVRDMVEPIFIEEISKRDMIEEPSEEEMRAYLKEQLKGEIYIH